MNRTRLLLIIVSFLMLGTLSCNKNNIVAERIKFKSFVQTTHYGKETAIIIDCSTGEQEILDFCHPQIMNIDYFNKHFNWLEHGFVDQEIPKYCYRIRIDEIESYYSVPYSTGKNGYPITCYKIIVINDESNGYSVNEDAYLLDGWSSPEYSVYGYPRYHVGDEYLIVDAYLPYLTEWRSLPADYAYVPFYIFEIHEIDGVEYLYPIRTDISSLDFKMEISNPAENQMYKADKDADVVRYLEEHNLKNPEFGYKVRLDDFVRYRNDYTAEWNARVTADGLPPMTTDPMKWGYRQVPEEELVYLNKREN